MGILVNRFNIGLDLLLQQVRFFRFGSLGVSAYANYVVPVFSGLQHKKVEEMNNCLAGEHPCFIPGV